MVQGFVQLCKVKTTPTNDNLLGDQPLEKLYESALYNNILKSANNIVFIIDANQILIQIKSM